MLSIESWPVWRAERSLCLARVSNGESMLSAAVAHYVNLSPTLISKRNPLRMAILWQIVWVKLIAACICGMSGCKSTNGGVDLHLMSCCWRYWSAVSLCSQNMQRVSCKVLSESVEMNTYTVTKPFFSLITMTDFVDYDAHACKVQYLHLTLWKNSWTQTPARGSPYLESTLTGRLLWQEQWI